MKTYLMRRQIDVSRSGLKRNGRRKDAGRNCRIERKRRTMKKSTQKCCSSVTMKKRSERPAESTISIKFPKDFYFRKG